MSSNRVLIDQSNNTVTTDTTSTQNNVILSPDSPNVVTVIENTSNIITVAVAGSGGGGGSSPLPSLTAGSVIFSNGTTIAQNNANFFWDNTNNRLAIGNNSPSHSLDVNGTTRLQGIVTAPSITGSLEGTASFALNATTASYILNAVSASFASTASFAISSSRAVTSSFALTASYLEGYISPFPFTGSAIITGSLTVTGSLRATGSINIDGQYTNLNTNNYTTAPIALRTNATDVPGLSIYKSSFGHTNSILFLSNDLTNRFSVGQGYIGSSNSLDFNIARYAASTWSDALRIFNSTGNVTINSSTDVGYKLDINGTGRVQSKLSIGTIGLYAQDQKISLDASTNVITGSALTIEAGSTQAAGTSAFQALSQTSRDWRGMAASSSGDVFAVVNAGDIYKRTGGTGNFVGLGQTSRQYQQISIAPNGDIYVIAGGNQASNGMYKSTNGGSTFTALFSGSSGNLGMCVAPNGDIYYSVTQGDIFKSTNGGSSFISQGASGPAWKQMAAAPNGDIYAAVNNDVGQGQIWKQTGGTGSFVSLGQTVRNYWAMTAASNGDVYATVVNGDIYKQTGGVGNFTALGQTTRNWYGITTTLTGDAYASVGSGDIYIQTAGTPNLNGGTLVLQSGLGKGTGTSTINFNTGTTTTSGNTLQVASTKMTILGNGSVGIGTTAPSYSLDVNGTVRATSTIFANNLAGIIFNTASVGDVRLRGDNNGTGLDGGDYVLKTEMAYYGNVMTDSALPYLGFTSGSGTSNFIAKYKGLIGNPSTTLGDSLIYDNGTNVGIGTTSPNTSSLLDITSTTKGFLPPRMTEAQKTAITSPAIGLMIYQTDGTEGLYIYASIGWLPVGGTASSVGSATALFNYYNFR
jgi:hypothetical protein